MIDIEASIIRQCGNPILNPKNVTKSTLPMGNTTSSYWFLINASKAYLIGETY